MLHKNKKRNNIFVYKNKIIQKRTIVGGALPSTITITIPSVYLGARLLNTLLVPMSLGILLLGGFCSFDGNGADFHAAMQPSQLVDNAEQMPGLTATAGPDLLNLSENSAEQIADSVMTDTAGADSINQNGVTSQQTIIGVGLGLSAAASLGLTAAGVAGLYTELEPNSNISEYNFLQDLETLEGPLREIVYDLYLSWEHNNRIRRVNFSLLRDAFEVLGHRATVLERHTDFIENNFPHRLERYRSIINRLRNISTNAQNTITQRAFENNTTIEDAFYGMQNHIDLTTEDLEAEIREHLPNFPGDPDTDDDMIAEAVAEQSDRYPRRNNTSLSNRGTSSGSGSGSPYT